MRPVRRINGWFRVRLLPGYVFQEFSKTFVLAFLAVIIVLFVGMGFQQVSSHKGLDFVSVFSLFPFIIAKAMPYALPFGTVCACALAYGRLSGDNEINAIRTSGVHLHYIITPVLAFSLLASAITYTVDDLLSPVLAQQKKYVAARVLKNLAEQFSSLGSPAFSEDINQRESIYLYIDKASGDQLEGVAIFVTKDDHLVETLMAKSGRLEYNEDNKSLTVYVKSGYVKWVDPRRPWRIDRVPALLGGEEDTHFTQELTKLDDPDTGGPSFQSTAENQRDLEATEKSLAATMSSKPANPSEESDWKKDIKDLTKKRRDLLIEIYGRLALAASCFFLALVTVPLSIIIKSTHMVAAFLLGLIVVIGYMISFIACSKFMATGVVPPLAALCDKLLNGVVPSVVSFFAWGKVIVLGAFGYAPSLDALCGNVPTVDTVPALTCIAIWAPNVVLLLFGAWLLYKVFKV